MKDVRTSQALKGGEFLIRETHAAEVFIPESFNEEQLMMAQACTDFAEQEVIPQLDELDKMDNALLAKMMTKAGEMGLLGIGVPEEYGGLGMTFNTSMLVVDKLGATGSFSTAIGAHTGIGTLPIQYYGSEEQKSKYLPLLASGEWIACYCLTEPEAGSDANNGKTKAVLNAAGTHYLISGQKIWISNAGIANLFIVFAKIDNDENLTAFLVEKAFGNITLGEEEKKMGIKGSSTRQVFFNETPVPVENMLSTRENGFKIAVNILNIGRIKLASACIGASKFVAALALDYAKQRKQFDAPIASFGAIKFKLAEMATRIYTLESAAYRAGQNIEDAIGNLIAEGMSKGEATLKGVEQYAIECAILKVLGSEVLAYTSDEGVQVYGGMGYSADAPMDRAYRDSRITRIYEGTNEINRMLLVGMLLRRAMKGEIDLFTPAKAIAGELLSMPGMEEKSQGILGEQKDNIKGMKKVILMVAGKAAQDLGTQFKDEQEIMMNIADMIIEVYAAESVVLRTEKLIELRGEGACLPQINMTHLYVASALDKVSHQAKEAIAAFVKEDEQKILLGGLKRFTKATLVNTKALRREIADYMSQSDVYPF